MRQHLSSHASVTYALRSASVGAKQVPPALSSLQGRNPHCINKVCAMGISLSNAEGFRKKGISPINAQIMPAKAVVMIAKNDGTFPFVMAKNAITSPKMMPL